MTASMHQQVPCTRKKTISLGSWLIAYCKVAPTLARQMWRHNYVIDRNEYLIFTLSESINPWVYSLQFLFKSTNNSWRYERNVSGCFFFWTQCTYTQRACFDTVPLWVIYWTTGSLADVNRPLSPDNKWRRFSKQLLKIFNILKAVLGLVYSRARCKIARWIRFSFSFPLVRTMLLLLLSVHLNSTLS